MEPTAVKSTSSCHARTLRAWSSDWLSAAAAGDRGIPADVAFGRLYTRPYHHAHNWIQGIDLVSRLLLDREDQVWLENPGYPAVELAFSASNSSIAHIPLDNEGLSVDQGRRLAPDAKLAYVHPSHQVPLAVTMSLKRRLELLSWAQKNNAWIMEDDYGCEYRYHGRPFPSLQGLCVDDRVIYLGTFNTVMFPALRIAYLVVPDALVDPCTSLLTAQGHHTVSVDQAALADFIADGHFIRHIRRMRTLYADRQAALVDSVQRHLSGIVSVVPDDAGMHLVGRTSEGGSDVKVSHIAADVGIKLAPMSYYDLGGARTQGLMFGYTGFSRRRIQENVRRLARALDEL